MTLAERLAEARLNAKRYPPNPTSDVGHAAEHDVAFTLRARLRGTGWRLHHGLRVQGPRGKREIDFVLTTPDVGVVVELKNWAGQVLLEEGHLIQRRPPPKAPVDHGPVFQQLQHKADLLQRLHGAEVELQPLVVFYNHRLQMPNEVRAREDVTTFTQLLDELPRRGHVEPSPEIAALRDTLDGIGGWDVLSLHGGRTLFGDLRHTPAGDRETDRGLEVRADRGTIRAWFSEPRVRVFALRRDGTRAEIPADPDAEVAFRPAGRSKVSRYALRHVTAIEFGSKPK